MTMIYHILGSEISQHNQRVLEFFEQEILPHLPRQQHAFYVVGKPVETTLNIRFFPTKKAIAAAVVEVAKQNPTARFLLHGQYNVWIWLALFCGKLPACRVIWHIWGADLYENSTHWKFRLFYPLRRLIQKKIGAVWATRGDLAYFWKKVRAKSKRDRVIYFPTKLAASDDQISLPNREINTILLGNSGDPANNHIAALTDIHRQFGQAVKLILPMGYPENNDAYIQQVASAAKRLFLPENVQILQDRLHFQDYLAILNCVDLGYFNFERQQGIGTICLLIEKNIPCVLHPDNPFCLDMRAENVPFLLANQWHFAQIAEIALALQAKDKRQIGFFSPNYRTLWQQALGAL